MGRRIASAVTASLFMIAAVVAAEEHAIVPTIICGLAAVGLAVMAQRLREPIDM